jgi:hypothetical protein
MTAIKALILATAASSVLAGPAAAKAQISDGTSNTLMAAEAHAPKPSQGIIAILIGL